MSLREDIAPDGAPGSRSNRTSNPVAAVDAELARAVERLRAAPTDQLAARQLDRLLRPRLAGYFRAGGAAPADVDDLVQETLRRVFSGMAELRSLASFLPWLFTVARHLAVSQGGRRAHDPLERADELEASDATGALLAAGADAERQLLSSERLTLVERAIRALPGRQRQCLLLRVRQELSYEEIGALLALSTLTVRNHLAEARAALRRALGEAEKTS